MRRRGRALPGALVAALAALAALPAGPGRRNGFAHGVVPNAVTHDSLSGAGGTAPAPDRPGPPPTGRNGEQGEEAGPGRPDADSGTEPGGRIGPGAGPGAPRQRLRAWAELLRVSALFSVPGDALAGAAAVGRRPGRGTALAIGASLCLYEAGMALNDWADRDEDAVDRPHRPIPSGRVSPAAALGAAGVLTAAGLTLAARAGRPALTVATGLAATVWAYDLHLKHTKAGPAAMAAARSLDLLLGATATATTTVAAGRAPGGSRARDNVAGASATARAIPGPGTPKASPTALPALPAALVLGAHTYGVTAVSRHETQGGSTATPLAVLATTTALAAAVLGEWRGRSPSGPTTTATSPAAGTVPAARPESLLGRTAADPTRLLTLALTGAYLRTAGPPLLHAALNPSPPLTQRAVGGGIRAMIPLQAALAARAGSPVTGLAVMGLVPLARSLARKVSLT
ncbi:SCO3242 family prenyltransferase [Streptomyces rubiginosohelvolus]|uniref:SCO3242 family prenyltransferase n=1 Tax=Streptomyces rubiginosohelvolus TaxID=67362 RepID=UPI00368F4FDB